MSDNLNQEDIDRLLSGFPMDDAGASGNAEDNILNPQEVETLAELYNISMSSAANTLSEILNQKVMIANPNIIDFPDLSDVLSSQENSSLIEIQYTSGLDSSVVLLVKNSDVAVIADLMMGGPGSGDADNLNELQLSAAGEAINQMMSAASANLASILNKALETAPPQMHQIAPGKALPSLSPDLQNKPIIGIFFKFSIGNLVESELIKLISLDSARKQLEMFMGSVDSLLEGIPDDGSSQSGGDTGRMFGGSAGPQKKQGYESAAYSQQPVTIQPAKFASFDNMGSMYGLENQNLELVLDVGLKLTVELGRAELPIKKVLELTRGSVIELDKIAGEPVDLLANGKLIAKGEVVVIEDNFGLRITSIISPADRLKNL